MIIENNHIDEQHRWIKPDTSGRPDIRSLIAQLDLKAAYRSREEIEELEKGTGGTVGFQVGLTNHEYLVHDVFDGYAAEGGVRRGDTILEIDGVPADGLSFSRVAQMLRGEPGTDVTLKIRTSAHETRETTITRTGTRFGPFVLLQTIGDGIGYLRISGFDDQTPVKVKEGLRGALAAWDIQGLILDIRANGGGILKAILHTAELFLDQDDVIGTLVSGGEVERTYKADASSEHAALAIVVLVDENTESGAELLAAALKDNKRALLAGARTAGKGEVRGIYELKDRSQLLITTAYMRTPAGIPIEGRGIVPDREIRLADEERHQVYRRIRYASSDLQADIGNDLQLQTAVGMLKNRMNRNRIREVPQ